MGAEVVGLKCFRGHETTMPELRKNRQAVKCNVGALPVPIRTKKKH